MFKQICCCKVACWQLHNVDENECVDLAGDVRGAIENAGDDHECPCNAELGDDGGNLAPLDVPQEVYRNEEGNRSQNCLHNFARRPLREAHREGFGKGVTVTVPT